MRIWVAAALSRVIVVVIAAAVAYWFEPYDSSSQLAFPACSSWVGRAVLFVGRPLASWDAIHFVGIAQHGYLHEHSYAFFPGFPQLIRSLAALLSPLVSDCSSAAHLLSGLIISNVSFVLAASVLEKLGGKIAALWFILSPANIFFSAVYTESPFALFVFLGVWLLSERRDFVAAVSFFVASCFRSNGILFSFLFVPRFKPLHGLVVLAPLVVHNVKCYWSLCPGRPWCSNLIPSCYSFVQSHYWSNGLFAYWTLNNVPNFLLAAPMVLLVVYLVAKRHSWGVWSIWCQLDFIMLGFCILGVFTVNVQVLTRLMAVFPNLYVSLADSTAGGTNRWILGYFLLYSLLGCILFPLFLPWT